ncbi:hypothetical protein ACXYTJ_14220 [Gilvimarinus sp. F26214L]|uniref:hypothetical protein n=1 Tax=Gilvimarinus sp. DZF01 TaxID=3461371 RepID=UPI0040459EE6
MINELLFNFAEWLGNTSGSQSLIGSFYMWNWIESTHVLTLMLSLGMLFMIDLRMLGWSFTNIPASKMNAQMNIPMFIGFAIMIITGLLLYYANAVHETQSIWFRIKLILLGAAGVNAWLFHKAMAASIDTWDRAPLPPKRIRIGAGLSLSLWILVIIMGRLMAYDWYDCDTPQGAFINWAVGCDLQ